MSTLTLPPNPADVAAPLLLGTVWNWSLYGVLLVQLYVYSYNFPKDRILLKLLVYGLFLLETLQTASSGADLYYWFASGFGNMERLSDPHASAFDVPIVGAIASLAVQFFFAYRVWVLSNKNSLWICLIIGICACSTVDAAAAFAGGIEAHISKAFASGRRLKALALTWLIGNTVTDILITVGMLYHLTKRRVTEGWPFGSRGLQKVVRLTVETNVMTTTVATISLLMVVIFPDKNWYACPTAIVGKLYSNTLLVSLNNRISIREGPSGGGLLPRSREIAAHPPSAPSSIPQVRFEKVMVSPFNQGPQSGGDGTREGTIDITSFMVSVAGQDAVGQSHHRMYVTG